MRDDDAHGHPVAARDAAVDELERADAEGDQVAGQRLSLAEDDALRRALDGLALDRRVGDGGVCGGDVERELPRHLEARLVEARERGARVEGLELREQVAVVVALAEEDAGAGREIHRPGVFEAQNRVAWLCGARELEPDEAVATGHDGGRHS